jgi:hypothetical protein
MRKITYGIVIAATALLAITLVVRAPQPATASASAQASTTIDPNAIQSTIDVNALPRLDYIPN